MSASTSNDESFCVDIRVGYDETVREELIPLLKERKDAFAITELERGMWQGVKIIRAYTTRGRSLASFIVDHHRMGDDFDYEIHETSRDANRASFYLPDLDTTRGTKIGGF